MNTKEPIAFSTIKQSIEARGPSPQFYTEEDTPPNLPRWTYGNANMFEQFCCSGIDRHIVVNRVAHHIIAADWIEFKRARIADREWMCEGFIGSIGTTHIFTTAFLRDYEQWVGLETIGAFVLIPHAAMHMFTPHYLEPNHDLQQAGLAAPGS